jgi:hypothetical protein
MGVVFLDPMPRGFTWLLMPLEVLHNPPRPTKDFHAQIYGEKG